MSNTATWRCIRQFERIGVDRLWDPDRLAFVMDMREGNFLADAPKVLDEAKRTGHQVDVHVPAVLKFAAGLVAAALLIHFAVVWLFDVLEVRTQRAQPKLSPQVVMPPSPSCAQAPAPPLVVFQMPPSVGVPDTNQVNSSFVFGLNANWPR